MRLNNFPLPVISSSLALPSPIFLSFSFFNHSPSEALGNTFLQGNVFPASLAASDNKKKPHSMLWLRVPWNRAPGTVADGDRIAGVARGLPLSLADGHPPRRGKNLPSCSMLLLLSFLTSSVTIQHNSHFIVA